MAQIDNIKIESSSSIDFWFPIFTQKLHRDNDNISVPLFNALLPYTLLFNGKCMHILTLNIITIACLFGNITCSIMHVQLHLWLFQGGLIPLMKPPQTENLLTLELCRHVHFYVTARPWCSATLIIVASIVQAMVLPRPPYMHMMLRCIMRIFRNFNPESAATVRVHELYSEIKPY